MKEKYNPIKIKPKRYFNKMIKTVFHFEIVKNYLRPESQVNFLLLFSLTYKH